MTPALLACPTYINAMPIVRYLKEFQATLFDKDLDGS